LLICDEPPAAAALIYVDKQISKQKGAVQEEPSNIEYLRNVFVKYLEYLALNNTKEISTIENLLFTELQVTKDQGTRLNLLRQQNTFWKKFLSISAIPVAQSKNKFSAGELKKKLFGGVATFMMP
jgi:hypothetical protein